MKVLFIGGTGTISAACVEAALAKGIEVYVLNRRSKPADGAVHITADISDESAVEEAIKGIGRLDAIAEFIAYVPDQIERDIRLFSGKTDQYIFISSASAYQKPPSNWIITESTPLANPFWQYSRDKIACEDRLMREYREAGFPITIVRPSHTYDRRSVPIALHGRNGSWQVIERIMSGKPVVIQGDGLSWWTFTHSSDFAKGFTGLLGNPAAIGEAVHITSDERLTWNSAYGIIARLLGKKADIVHVSTQKILKYAPDLEGTLLGDKSNSAIFDNGKIKRLVPDYAATVRFDQGVAVTLKYILDNKEYQRADPEFDTLCDKIIEDDGMWNAADSATHH